MGLSLAELIVFVTISQLTAVFGVLGSLEIGTPTREVIEHLLCGGTFMNTVLEDYILRASEQTPRRSTMSYSFSIVTQLSCFRRAELRTTLRQQRFLLLWTDDAPGCRQMQNNRHDLEASELQGETWTLIDRTGSDQIKPVNLFLQ